MELCDRIEIKKPYPLGILNDIHPLILARIEHYFSSQISEKDIESDITLRNIKKQNPLCFVETVKEILSSYNLLLKQEQSRSRSITEINRRSKKNEVQQQIEALIDSYLNVAIEFIQINIYPENVKKKATCPECGIILENIAEDVTSGAIECCCGFESQNFLFVSAIRDNGFTASSSGGYEDRDNFFKKMQKKQGKWQFNLPKDLFDNLDSSMIKKGHRTGEEIRKLPTDYKGEKPGTDLEMLITALSDIGLSKHYNDVDYIAHRYWGWTLLDFAHLEEKLLTMYDQTQTIYNQIPDRERVAALNTEVRLYLELWALDFKVSRTRFRFQDSQSSLEFHQTMWRKMCDETGTSFHCIV